MSPAQLKELQELSHIFSQGKASPKQIQQLSALLAQINCYGEEDKAIANEQANFYWCSVLWLILSVAII